ncbi:lysylphosphatidylglycerol synthase domain-containing protein [Aequorivita sediminis]|uniref:lysylphosphatidylglycerol synthase domain-containing protein n=1 Tax=Aequorivita sediminis TaxID=3073653 RepID=UPI0028A96563|nr:lysylphosphatidylglycerol synthase domain-containing protein [Aequorivita sp. F6058]
MTTESYKAKQYLLASAKALILVITFGYIFYKLKNSPTVNLVDFISLIQKKGSNVIYFLSLFLGLTAANWFFEILKWQTLVSTIEKINFKTAMKQSLASLTVSLATPNRVGEYGAKVLFFERLKRKKILFLNFLSGTAQMLATVIFGVIGLFYFLRNFKVDYSIALFLYFGLGLITILCIAYYFNKKKLKNKHLINSKAILFFKKIPFHVKLKTIVFSIFRYVIFSGMFYCMLLFFGADIAFVEAMLLIFSMYLLVSILPTLFIFDVVIRGGVAVWVFSFAGISELVVLPTVLAMWFFNFVLPSILGSLYVVTYQLATR